mmetsp:Transcript_43044/g.108168  ORF Transcript_43044/g.108168 Transcript_43044/m.108168 type:complete len:213 (-) Transcript_43044:7-645(-)
MSRSNSLICSSMVFATSPTTRVSKGFRSSGAAARAGAAAAQRTLSATSSSTEAVAAALSPPSTVPPSASARSGPSEMAAARVRASRASCQAWSWPLETFSACWCNISSALTASAASPLAATLASNSSALAFDASIASITALSRRNICCSASRWATMHSSVLAAKRRSSPSKESATSPVKATAAPSPAFAAGTACGKPLPSICLAVAGSPSNS